jgi:hypothetical protein
MKSVNRFESNLIKILYAVMGKISMANALPLISRAFRGSPPRCLSRDAIDLIEQAIRKGCINKLVNWGGWQTESFLRNSGIAKGRLWERTNPEQLGLTFSEHTLDLLIWLTNANPTGARAKWKPPKKARLKVGDQFFFFLLLGSIQHTEQGQRLAEHPSFSKNGLIRLYYPQLYLDRKFPDPKFQPWVTGVGAAILEALQGPLASQWLNMERKKSTITRLDVMQRLGDEQTAVLNGLITAANNAKRHDLFRFLLQLLSGLLSEGSKSSDWTEHLNFEGVRMADRESSTQAALAVLHAVRSLSEQNQRFATVNFIDEDYQASQLWKQNWELLEGDRLIGLCRKVIQETTF